MELLNYIKMPAIVEINNTYGSMLLLYIHSDRVKMRFLIDRCRWLVLENNKIIFYDLDIECGYKFDEILPNMMLERAEFNNERLILHFGQREFWIFMTEAYHDFLNDGLKKNDPLWEEMPQDQKDNFSVSFDDGRETVGHEFEAFLNPNQYPWGKEFLRREAELLSSNPPN